MPLLDLINDDEPEQFAPHLATVVRDGLRIGAQPGLVVEIDPPIEETAGGPLGMALLVPRPSYSRTSITRHGACRMTWSTVAPATRAAPTRCD